jgi:hypothetical protein
MNFKKLGVVLLLVMCVVGFSMSNVYAGTDYHNTLEVGQWYNENELNRFKTQDYLKGILTSEYRSGPDLIAEAVVDYKDYPVDELNDNIYRNEYVKPLKAGDYCIWTENSLFTTDYYWHFVLAPFNLSMRNSKTTITVKIGETEDIVVTGLDKNREGASNVNVAFSLDDLNKGSVTSFSTVTNQFGQAFFRFRATEKR